MGLLEPMEGWDHYKPMPFVTVSTLIAFARCPRRYFYRYGCSLGPAEGPHPALKFGEAIHKALGVLATSEDLFEALEAFRSVWQDRDDLGDELRNSGTAANLLASYLTNHGKGRSLYVLEKPPELPGVHRPDSSSSDYEVPFAVDIGLDVPLAGRIDGLCRHRQTSELWGLEWKTSRELSTRFLNAFELNVQVFTYVLALRTMGVSVRGMFVEGLQVAKTKQGNELVPIYVPDHLLEDHVAWLRLTVSQLRQCQEMKNFPKDFSGCSPYGLFGMPGYVCEYDKLCKQPQWTGLTSLYTKLPQYSPFADTETASE